MFKVLVFIVFMVIRFYSFGLWYRGRNFLRGFVFLNKLILGKNYGFYFFFFVWIIYMVFGDVLVIVWVLGWKLNVYDGEEKDGRILGYWWFYGFVVWVWFVYF